MKNRLYRITLKHDAGIVALIINALCALEARELIKEIEGCPNNAILSIEAL